MKKTLALPTTPTTSVLLDALVVVCVMLGPIMDGPGMVAGNLLG